MGQMGCSVGVRLRCGSAGSMVWSSTGLSGQQTWAPPGLRHCPRSCLPGLSWLPGVWCSFSPSSAAVPVTRPPACLPACLGESGQAVQFLVKEDKTQADKRKRLHLSVRSRQLVYSHSLAEGRTRLSSWGLCSHHLYRGTDKGSTYSLSQQSGRDGGSKEDRVQPFPAALRCSAPDAVTPTLLLQFL